VRRVALAILLCCLAAAGVVTASVTAGRSVARPADLTTSTTETTSTSTTETTETTSTTTTTTPSPTPKPKPTPRPKPKHSHLARGITIGGVHVGGLSRPAALAVLKLAFSSPLVVTVDDKRYSMSPKRIGARAYVDGAVSRAMSAPSGSNVRLVVTVKGDAVRRWVSTLAAKNDREMRDAHVVLQHLAPRIVEERTGLEVKQAQTVAVVAQALRDNRRGPVRAVVHMVPPSVRSSSISSIIVIRRGSNQLRYYERERLVRTFVVATGQSVYPTPIGSFHIIQMSRNPWWYPPASPWAQGAKPIPPGPGNPLGTRWMGISSPSVGIHGTPDSASLGYSASHGCIRMAIPSAEWLFDHVTVGTPVIIVPV